MSKLYTGRKVWNHDLKTGISDKVCVMCKHGQVVEDNCPLRIDCDKKDSAVIISEVSGMGVKYLCSDYEVKKNVP